MEYLTAFENHIILIYKYEIPMEFRTIISGSLKDLETLSVSKWENQSHFEKEYYNNNSETTRSNDFQCFCLARILRGINSRH